MKRLLFLITILLLISTNLVFGQSAFTDNLNLEKPGVGDQNWGPPLNSNADIIDTALGTEHNTSGQHTNVNVQTKLVVPNGITVTPDTTGEITLDTDLFSVNQGSFIGFDGQQIINLVSTTNAPTDAYVPTFTLSTGLVTWKIIPVSLKPDGTVPLTADWDAGSFKITAETLESDVATSTAPLIVASTTLVSNLNADTTDGFSLDQPVTSGATPTYTNTNFTEATDKNYVTDAEAVVIGNTSGTNTGDMSDADIKTAYENNADTNAYTDSEKTNLGNQSGTNSGDVTIGTANGLSLISQALSMALADTDTTGAVSDTDWDTFNNKVSADSPTFTTKITTPIIDLTGGQIAFPASQSASADPNTLDDYEEGTYTATLTCGTSGTVTLASNFNELSVRFVGDLVFVWGQIAVDSVSSPTGSLTLNLPVAADAGTEGSNFSPGSIWYNTINALGSPGALALKVTAGSSDCVIVEQSTVGTADLSARIKAGTNLAISFVYGK